MNIFIRWIGIVALVAWASLPAMAQDHRLGTWHGDVVTPVGTFTLLFQLQDNPGKGLSGDVESVNQAPGEKMPLANIVATPGTLAFSIPQIGARYEAVWNEADQTWAGVFRQGREFPLALTRGPVPVAAVVAGLDGAWRGLLARDGRNLRLVLHVETTAGGTRATLDSPDLGAYGLLVKPFERKADVVRLAIPSAGVQFEGSLDARLDSLSGRWSRAGLPDAQVRFKRDATQVGEHPRSQWPLAAANYRVQNVSFANPQAPEVTLAGTLTLPQGQGPFPAAVLIAGSGLLDRDESMSGHKPFAVLADYLSRRGIAVLRYDKRGGGESTGNYELATSADFAADANAAFAFLQGRADIHPHAIGFVGHSEGGMVGPLAAASNDKLAFVILLAGPGTPTDQLVLSQQRMGLPLGGATTMLDKAEPVLRSFFQVVRDSADAAQAAQQLDQLLTPEALQALGVAPAQRELVVHRYATPWMRYFLKYRPAEYLQRLTVPVLALNGSLDRQVPAAENLAAIRAALAGHRDVTVLEMPGLNHLFQTASTGAIGEYAEIEETFSPKAMDVIARWTLQRFGAQAPGQ
jgi:pimeloyl-ACP methyl ester carboxylesterase